MFAASDEGNQVPPLGFLHALTRVDATIALGHSRSGPNNITGPGHAVLQLLTEAVLTWMATLSRASSLSPFCHFTKPPYKLSSKLRPFFCCVRSVERRSTERTNINRT